MNINYEEIYDYENQKNNQNNYISNKFQNNNENVEIFINELPETKSKKIKISYEDILSSLNMTVIDGKLHYLNKNINKYNNKDTNKNNNFLQPKKKVQFFSNQTKYNINGNQVMNQGQNQYNKNNINIDKNNNFLNNNINVNNNVNLETLSNENENENLQNNGLRLTREQYNKIISIQRIKRIQAIQRINKMKPNKMFFSDNKNNDMMNGVPNNYNNYNIVNGNNFNRLFNFKN